MNDQPQPQATSHSPPQQLLPSYVERIFQLSQPSQSNERLLTSSGLRSEIKVNDDYHTDSLVLQRWNEQIASNNHQIDPLFAAYYAHQMLFLDTRLDPHNSIPGSFHIMPHDLHIILASFETLDTPSPATPLILLINEDGDDIKVDTHKAIGQLAGGISGWEKSGLKLVPYPPLEVMTALENNWVRQEGIVPTTPDFDLGQIKDHLEGKIQHLSLPMWLKDSAMLSCIDSRDDHRIVGTPGGDIAEFIVVLTAFEKVCRIELTAADISSIFQYRLRDYSSFYAHTSWTKINALMQRFPGYDEVYCQMESCPEDAISILIAFIDERMEACLKECGDDEDRISQCKQDHDLAQLMCQPEFIGCGHVHYLLTCSEKYMVRRELVYAVLICFFRALVERHPSCCLAILKGSYNAKAVLNVTSQEDPKQPSELNIYSCIPLVPPCYQDIQIFVNHGDVAAYLREQLTIWLFSYRAQFGVQISDRAQVLTDAHGLAFQHLMLTASQLAAGKPMFTLVSRHCQTNVVEGGTVSHPPPDDAGG